MPPPLAPQFPYGQRKNVVARAAADQKDEHEKQRQRQSVICEQRKRPSSHANVLKPVPPIDLCWSAAGNRTGLKPVK